MIEDNLRLVEERIARASSKVKRDPGEITLVAVTKGRASAQIQEAIAAGISDIGENKVQEALSKYETVSFNRTPNTEHLTPIRWHMVGHLQRNKAKNAVDIFDLIQSVDSLRLAQEIDKEASKINKVQDILIEVKTSGETAKFGLKPEETLEVIKEISGLKNISIKGLMTIAPFSDNPEGSRSYFRRLRELKDKINGSRITDYGLRILSMGMSDDFEVAIEEGSNMVRLGRAIFE